MLLRPFLSGTESGRGESRRILAGSEVQMTRRCAPACCRSPYCAVRKIGGSPPGTAQSGGEPDEGRRSAPLGRVPAPQAWVRGEQCSHYSALRSTGGLESPQNVFLESCFGTNIPHSGAAANRNCAQRGSAGASIGASKRPARRVCSRPRAAAGSSPSPRRSVTTAKLGSAPRLRLSVSPFPRFSGSPCRSPQHSALAARLSAHRRYPCPCP